MSIRGGGGFVPHEVRYRQYLCFIDHDTIIIESPDMRLTFNDPDSDPVYQIYLHLIFEFLK